MIAALIVGLLAFLIANFFFPAGTALIIGVVVGILIYLANTGTPRI